MTVAGSAQESPGQTEGLRWFVLRLGQPVSVRVVDADALDGRTPAEVVFESRPDEPGELVLSVVRGWGKPPRLDLYWDATGAGPGEHGYAWSVSASGSLLVTARGETVLEYGPAAWHQWQP
jgi:hypothetical protein